MSTRRPITRTTTAPLSSPRRGTAGRSAGSARRRRAGCDTSSLAGWTPRISKADSTVTQEESASPTWAFDRYRSELANDHMPHYVVRRVKAALNEQRKAVNRSLARAGLQEEHRGRPASHRRRRWPACSPGWAPTSSSGSPSRGSRGGPRGGGAHRPRRLSLRAGRGARSAGAAGLQAGAAAGSAERL